MTAYQKKRRGRAAIGLLSSVLIGVGPSPAVAGTRHQQTAQLGDGAQEANARALSSHKPDAEMRDGGVVMPPAGWLDYCRRTPRDVACQAALLTPQRLHELHQVQAAMWRLPRRSDEQLYHRAEYWVPAGAAGGDCEDIALAAREQLLRLGWPASAVRLATAWTERNEHHLVLTVDIVHAGQVATLILDSRFAQVQTWQELKRIGYRFEARQASRGATWVAIRDDEPMRGRWSRDAVQTASNDASVPTAASQPTAPDRDPTR